MKPSAGTVTSAPIAAPMPSVESSRKTLRGYRSGSSGPSSSSAASSETGSSATTGSGSGAARTSRVTSRIQAKPKRSARTPPATASHQLMISPMRMRAIPPAKAKGRIDGAGRCCSESSWAGSAGRSRSSATQLPS